MTNLQVGTPYKTIEHSVPDEKKIFMFYEKISPYDFLLSVNYLALALIIYIQQESIIGYARYIFFCKERQLLRYI